MASREIDKVINGRLVIARPRRSEIEVDVYSGTEKNPDQLIGEWGMPTVLGILLAMQTAESQTPRPPADPVNEALQRARVLDDPPPAPVERTPE